MVCYYHPDRPAIGLCKHCFRGLCPDCAILIHDQLACRNRHEEPLLRVILATNKTVLQTERISSGYLRNAIFYGLVGLVFAVLGALQYRFLGFQALVFMIIGVLLLYAAVANLLEALKYR